MGDPPRVPSAAFEVSSKLLKGAYMGEYIGDYYRVYKGDAKSLDYSLFSSVLMWVSDCSGSFPKN